MGAVGALYPNFVQNYNIFAPLSRIWRIFLNDASPATGWTWETGEGMGETEGGRFNTIIT